MILELWVLLQRSTCILGRVARCPLEPVTGESAEKPLLRQWQWNLASCSTQTFGCAIALFLVGHGQTVTGGWPVVLSTLGAFCWPHVAIARATQSFVGNVAGERCRQRGRVKRSSADERTGSVIREVGLVKKRKRSSSCHRAIERVFRRSFRRAPAAE